MENTTVTVSQQRTNTLLCLALGVRNKSEGFRYKSSLITTNGRKATSLLERLDIHNNNIIMLCPSYYISLLNNDVWVWYVLLFFAFERRQETILFCYSRQLKLYYRLDSDIKINIFISNHTISTLHIGYLY